MPNTNKQNGKYFNNSAKRGQTRKGYDHITSTSRINLMNIESPGAQCPASKDSPIIPNIPHPIAYNHSRQVAFSSSIDNMIMTPHYTLNADTNNSSYVCDPLTSLYFQHTDLSGRNGNPAIHAIANTTSLLDHVNSMIFHGSSSNTVVESSAVQAANLPTPLLDLYNLLQDLKRIRETCHISDSKGFNRIISDIAKYLGDSRTRRIEVLASFHWTITTIAHAADCHTSRMKSFSSMAMALQRHKSSLSRLISATCEELLAYFKNARNKSLQARKELYLRIDRRQSDLDDYAVSATKKIVASEINNLVTRKTILKILIELSSKNRKPHHVKLDTGPSLQNSLNQTSMQNPVPQCPDRGVYSDVMNTVTSTRYHLPETFFPLCVGTVVPAFHILPWEYKKQIRFFLDDTAAAQIKKDMNTLPLSDLLCLRCFANDDISQRHSWPIGLESIFVNGINTEFSKNDLVIIDGDEDVTMSFKNLPAFLNSFVLPGENTIELVLSPTDLNRSFTFTVDRWKQFCALDATSLIKTQKMTKEESIKLIDSKLTSTAQNEEVICQTDFVAISLLCPFTRQRIQTPIRGRDCKHPDVFDLANWIQSHVSTRNKYCLSCPLCSRYLTLEQVFVDSFLQKILEELDDTSDTVRIRQGGIYESDRDVDAKVVISLITDH